MSVVRPPEPSFPVGKSLAAAALGALGLGAIKLANALRTEASLLMGGTIAIIVSMVLALVVIGRHILGPLDAAARHKRHPTQFTLADFLALMFLFQLPIALIRLAVPHETPSMAPLYGFAWAASSLMWGFSVQTLSRAGIVTPWRRVVFLSAVLPIAYFGSIVFLFAALLGAIAIFFEGPPRITGFWWYIAVGASLPAAFYWAAKFVRTMVAGSQQDESPTAKQGDDQKISIASP